MNVPFSSRDHMGLLRQELDELRQDLVQLEGKASGGAQGAAPTAKADCLTVAMALAQDLGSGFSSEQSHDLAERGTDWFTEP